MTHLCLGSPNIVEPKSVKFALQTFLLTAVFHFVTKQRQKVKSEIDISSLTFFVRVKPNLECETWTKLQKGTKVKIKDKSAKPMEIDGESLYWYRVDAENLPDGWIYGKYLDIENE